MITPARPLAGLRVIEIANGRAAAFCGRQFAVWGADVVLLEPEGGSQLRQLQPLWRTPGRVGGSVPFEFLAAGKRSVRATEGSLDRVLQRTDVLILDEAAAARATLDAEALARSHPGLVLIHLSNYGLGTASVDSDAGIAEIQARTGYLALNGPSDGPPTLAPDGLLEHAIGANAFVGAMASLVRRRRTGCGGLVEISGLETVAGLLPYLREQQLGVSSPRQGGTPEGARLIRCLDGYISVAPAIPSHLPAYRDALGMSEVDAPDSLLEGGRGLAADRAAAAFAPFAARLPVDAIFLGLQSAGVVCGIVQTPDAVLEDTQLSALGFFRNAAFDGVGDVRLAGRAARLNGVGAPSLSRAPEPGSTRLEDVDWPVVPDQQAQGDPAALPLAGLKVLDLTQAWIGPVAGMILGDLGADVIKVEGPARPDIWRLLGQAEADADATGSPLNRSCYFNAANRNKLGLGLDLARPAGAELFLRLAGQSDVVLENFTPQVMARFGLAYPNLAAINPALVMTSFSGFGASGPYAGFKANGVSIEALAGWDSLHRDGQGEPVLMASYPADPICGLQMAAATLVALYRRTVTGQGGHVEGSMLESATEYIGDSLLAQALSRAGAEVSAPPRRPVVVGDEDTGFVVQTLFGRLVPVRDTLSALQDATLSARKWFLSLHTPGQGERLHNGHFWRFHGLTRRIATPPPKLGEHTAELLAVRLDLSPDQIEALFAEGLAGSVA